jgi:photosystem II stability/assembly factor-like uncharacterized protein
MFLQGVIEILHRCRAPIAIAAACILTCLAISNSALAASPSQGGDVLWYGKAPSGWGGVVTDMKLIAPNVGWAERAGRLYWTTDGGADWQDITPSDDGHLAGIFFLSSSTGWITINHPGLESDLLSTTDAGATWSRTTIPVLAGDYGVSVPKGFTMLGGAGPVAFVDSLHGWANLTYAGDTMNSRSGFLLVTSNGGRTWSHPDDAPNLLQSEMLLVTPSEGWLYGDDEIEGTSRLYVTRNGARSWQEVAPQPADLADSDVMGVPTFKDAQHGFLQVNGIRGGDPKYLTMVLMATSDGGRTWKTDRTVANLDDLARNRYGSPTIVGSDWIFAAASDHHPVLTRVGPGARVDANTHTAEPSRSYGEIDRMSFASPTQGWVIVSGNLMSTTDGGATWSDISPGPKPHVINPVNSPAH